MFDVGASLLTALSTARDTLARAAGATARAHTTLGSSRSEAQMATLAQQTLFSEALMNAVHARLAEVKNVTHG